MKGIARVLLVATAAVALCQERPVRTTTDTAVQIAQLQTRFDSLDGRYTKLDDRLAKLDDRMSKLEDRMAGMETTLQNLVAILAVVGTALITGIIGLFFPKFGNRPNTTDELLKLIEV